MGGVRGSFPPLCKKLKFRLPAFPRSRLSRSRPRQKQTHMCCFLYERKTRAGVSECASCALLRLSGDWLPTGPDACCPFAHIAPCRCHVWRFLVLCFFSFEMLKMTFRVVSHLPSPPPPFFARTHPYWTVRGCLWVLVSVENLEHLSGKSLRTFFVDCSFSAVVIEYSFLMGIQIPYIITQLYHLFPNGWVSNKSSLNWSLKVSWVTALKLI